MAESDTPLVGIIMGSVSDMETMAGARDMLKELDIPFEMRVVSAHRTPVEMFEYAEEAAARGIKVIIAGAGGAAHLPGMTASRTLLPVIGVPVQSKALNGLDSLLSITQMPKGVPVATVAIGNAVNAALLAARILALGDADLSHRLAQYVQRMHDDVVSIKL
jgi:5-(carboxyamino)imidazole ribonucleotide mutase